MSIKTKLARTAVKSTAKHTAHGTISKFERKPMRTATLLLIGATLGFAAARLLGGSPAPPTVASAPAPTV